MRDPEESVVNVDMEPEDALRLLLGETRREPVEDQPQDDDEAEGAEPAIG